MDDMCVCGKAKAKVTYNYTPLCAECERVYMIIEYMIDARIAEVRKRLDDIVDEMAMERLGLWDNYLEWKRGDDR